MVGLGFTGKILISGKLKEILETQRKHGIQFVECPILHKNKYLNDYWILNVFQFDMTFVDFNKSKYVGKKKKSEKEAYNYNLKFSSFVNFKEMIDAKNELGYSQLFIETIKLVPSISEDFFVLRYVEGGVKFLVSEKLKDTIEKEACTGIEFMPVEMKLTEWLQGGERVKIYGNP